MFRSSLMLAAVALVSAASATAQTFVPMQAATAASLAQYDDDDFRPGPGWDRDIEIRCASRNYSYNLCQVDTGRGSQVELVSQLSGSECVEGRSWGWNRAGIWVDRGCSGAFRVARRWERPQRPDRDRDRDRGRDDDGGWRPGPDFDRRIEVRCASRNYAYNLCQVDTGRGSDVRIARQISGTACEEGRTWGWNRAGIWVDNGCEAIFAVERRWR